MFGRKKENIPEDITDRIEHPDTPISQADVHSEEMQEELPPTKPKTGPASYTPLPHAEMRIPTLSGIESDEQGKMLETKQDQFVPQPFTPPLLPEKRAKAGKGPLFISLKKYKELRADLDQLKHTSAQIRAILGRLKENRDSGFDLLEKSTDALLKLEEQGEAVNNLLKS